MPSQTWIECRGAGIAPRLWCFWSRAGNVCAGCLCVSDQALHMDLAFGNAVALRTASTQDSDAVKSSLLHSNQKAPRWHIGSQGIGWMIQRSRKVHCEVGMCLFRLGCGMKPIEINFIMREKKAAQHENFAYKCINTVWTTRRETASGVMWIFHYFTHHLIMEENRWRKKEMRRF